MYKSLKRIKPSHIYLIVIILLTIFLRLVKINELFHFTYDESVFAFVGRKMFVGNHIPLIGGVTPFHVHLAPYFYWLSGILLSLSRFDLLAWGYFTAITAGLSVLLLYVFINENFSTKTARIAILIYAFSFYINAFERHYWGLYFNPLLTLIVLISLTKIIKKHNKYYLLLGVALAFGFHTDPSALVLILLSLIAIIKYKLPLSKNSYGKLGLLIFFGSFIPLVIFDIRHNFVNIKGIIEYKAEVAESASLSLENKLNSLFIIPNYFYKLLVPEVNPDLAQFYSYCSRLVQNRLKTPLLGTFVGVLILLISIIKFNAERKNNPAKSLTVILTLITLLGVLIYSGFLGRPFFDHYISTLLPVAVLFTASLIANTKSLSNLGMVIVLSLFIFFNTRSLTEAYHSYGYRIKTEAIKWAVENVSGDFSLESLSTCHKYNGYRYLFLVAGKEPVKSYVDPNFFWLFDSPPADTHPPEVVVMVAKDYENDTKTIELYQKYKENEIKSKTFGLLEVLIVDNTKSILYDF